MQAHSHSGIISAALRPFRHLHQSFHDPQEPQCRVYTLTLFVIPERLRYAAHKITALDVNLNDAYCRIRT